ncbi:MAG: ribose-phosphate pyrophosphokinase [Eubacterium coprostanoligenes]|uniref:ribose-phosphate pyrophosphokinase n=1 Tax=Eubacterium coprostanoligenes TaxID=290054 RepID=UPI0023538BE2|nr:ribose-phosphate pyrophosphokinase [Eubacterium coprostanoligenes]MCI6361379.1 ribose-phosphate pyrophosphokinase [Eubacterium coprostanoligenes]MCI7265376.1 ribose-phosphate pyrophosphokinase [Eubacterium coprostanoligenes]MDD7358273.1 ribose-phosphate pyrophosphokinase [Eubacterium coprostanoligenes]MDY4698390.1 ribose-phosphate pyrophosphokinase [Eubacterium coprostanoligenes]
MPRITAEEVQTIPYGPLGIIALPGTEGLAQKIDNYLVKWRAEQAAAHKENIAFYGYQRDSYLIDTSIARFGSGEGKAVINDSIRGYDLYIIVDCFNYSVTYNMYGMDVPKSPDDHFSDLKRVISAASSKAKRINVIMPMLYEGRQHKRSSRESLDCAMALQELTALGVENIITFDAHDQRVQNSIPHKSFENVMPTYQMIKAIVNNVDDLSVNPDHLMIISPDEGAMHRCIYFATQLGVNLGMFYKRRDYTRVVNGRNPIVAHQYLGDSVEGKDIIIVDDMISSGESMLEVAKKLKELKAKRIFVCTAFGLFCNGLEIFDKAHEEGIFEKVFTTNGVYQSPELLSRDWYESVELSKYLAYFLDTINHDLSVSSLLDNSNKIDSLLKKKGLK